MKDKFFAISQLLFSNVIKIIHKFLKYGIHLLHGINTRTQFNNKAIIPKIRIKLYPMRIIIEVKIYGEVLSNIQTLNNNKLLRSCKTG